VDFKGWWHDREGRCEPLTGRDEYSRYVLELRALPDARTATVQTCFEGLFAQYGLPEAIRDEPSHVARSLRFESGIYIQGRSNRAAGFIAHTEKHLERCLAGWNVVPLRSDHRANRSRAWLVSAHGRKVGISDGPICTSGKPDFRTRIWPC
jgi:hypothetical protein